MPVIFITGHGTVESAIEATKLGAYDYLFKPLELDEMRTLLDKAFNLSRMVRVQPVLGRRRRHRCRRDRRSLPRDEGSLQSDRPRRLAEFDGLVAR